MKDSFRTPARELSGGMGQAVADRTILRKVEKSGEKVKETWADVAHRVALGNSLLHPALGGDEKQLDLVDLLRERDVEYHDMNHHLRQASILMSGRHLQHGDETQPSRNIEVFTNCSTSAMSFLSFYLLLNGSGVGRAYDDEMMLVDWDNLPIVIPVIEHSHKDVQSGEITTSSKRDVEHFYKGSEIINFEVPDSREGWTKAFEKMEYLTFTKKHKNSVLIMDFTKVRPRGSPIQGMQNRPASGPGPMMNAVSNIAKLRGAGMDPWRSTMYADHYLAECVLVGGARRAARMATKYWKDKTVLDFIGVKQGGFLWTSNNSVTVDAEFWEYANMSEYDVSKISTKKGREIAKHAQAVFEAVCNHSYFDGTGEPGFINVDKLTWSDEGIEVLADGNFAESEKLKLNLETLELSTALAKVFTKSVTKTITNPCGEIVLGKLGGYCVIADVVPYHAGTEAKECLDADGLLEWDEDAEDSFRVSTRALIRTNLMDALYSKEVRRTNRIGVGITGLHEYAWTRFGFGWKDIIDENASIEFWLMLSRFKRAVQDEAKSYSELLGISVPHTNTTMKPAGCATLDSTVKTTEGVKSLQELFEVNGYDPKLMSDGSWLDLVRPIQVLDENNEPKDVTKLYVNGVKPVFEIIFEDGHTVKLTGNHKLKTADGWKRVDELTDEDDIVQF